MGFLMGAYGKLMAGQRVRKLQFQLHQVISRHRRITNEIETKTKMYAAQERNMKSQMQAQMQASIYGYMGIDPMFAQGNISNPAFWQGAGQTMDMNKYAQYAQMVQMQFAQANAMWQNVFEMQKDADLQALKDIEESLQIEKESLESQIKIAETDYNSMKDMEKAGVKNLTPEYTGGQG